MNGAENWKFGEIIRSISFENIDAEGNMDFPLGKISIPDIIDIYFVIDIYVAFDMCIHSIYAAS